ncbi:MAG: amidase [Alphaproteobacteria bacterium]|nr:amidase [Alphaproteobacteria bacterium]
MELWQYDATDLARLIRLGQVSAKEAVTACLARIDAVNPKLNAIVRRMDDEALAQADAADDARKRGESLGPLHGVPVTTKINTDQKGHPTDNGAVEFKNLMATEDAPVVANLRRSGAIFVGRTNAPAFSMRAFSDNALHGRTYNPLDRDVSPGGSSGGAGAATAVGMGAIAHGNDIGGSVRIPAYCNGVVALRVGLGRVPAFNPSATAPRPIGALLMATQGPHTRTVRDARLALEVMAKGDPRDTRWVDAPIVGPAPPRPLRIAIAPVIPGGFTHPAQSEAVRRAGRHLANAGYVVEEMLPPDVEEVVRVWHVIGSGDVFRPLGPIIEKYGDANAVKSYQLWRELSPPPNDPNAVLEAYSQRDLHLFRWQSFFQNHMAVVMPTLCDLPPPVDQDLTLDGQRKILDALRVSFLAPALGLPGLAVPVGSHGHLRTGVQIVTGRMREDLALDAGEVIEAAEGLVRPVDPAW